MFTKPQKLKKQKLHKDKHTDWLQMSGGGGVC